MTIKLLFSVFALTFALTGCHHLDNNGSQIGTHKVVAKRSAMPQSYIEEHGNFYQYNEKFLWFRGLTVKIDNEKVWQNNQELGLLKPNDAVTIGDNGVLVTTPDGKQLDYGATKAYLQRNAAEATTTPIVSQAQTPEQP